MATALIPESPASPSPPAPAIDQQPVISTGKFHPLIASSSASSTSGKYELATKGNLYDSSSSSEEEMEQEFTTPTSEKVRFLKSPKGKKVAHPKKVPHGPKKKIDLSSGTPTAAKRKAEEAAQVSPSSQGSSGTTAAVKKTKASPSAVKNGKTETGSVVVYVKAADGNIVKDVAFKRAKQFRQELILAARGEVKAVEAKADSLRVVCFNVVQVDALLKTTSIMGIPVKVTRPWSQNKKPAEPKPFRGVIHNVDLDMTDDDIAEETGATSVKRLTRVESGDLVQTTTVALTFKEEPPKTVNIGFYRFRVCRFIPAPIRCGRCQRFGHPTSACRSKQARCVRCGGGHGFEDCPNKGKEQQARCVNCGENHSAAYKGCRRYQEVKETLRIVGKERLSYADALKKQKQEAKNKAPVIVVVPPVATQETPVPPPAGSYAAVAATSPQAAVKQGNVCKPVVKKPVVVKTSAVVKSQVSKPEAVKPVTVSANVPASDPAAARSTDERIDILIETMQSLLSLMLQVINLNPSSYDQSTLTALATSVEKLSPSFKSAAQPAVGDNATSQPTPAAQPASQQPAAGQ